MGKILIKIPLLIIEGIKLFFILPLSVCSKKLFTHFWNKYHTIDMPKTLFNLCVQWLMHTGKRFDMSYEEINVLIFCFIWPVITIFFMLLSLYFLIFSSAGIVV